MNIPLAALSFFLVMVVAAVAKAHGFANIGPMGWVFLAGAFWFAKVSTEEPP